MTSSRKLVLLMLKITAVLIATQDPVALFVALFLMCCLIGTLMGAVIVSNLQEKSIG